MSPHEPSLHVIAQGRLPILLRHAWYGLNQAFRRQIAHLGLTPDQYTALRTLIEHEGISQKNLSRFMASDPNTIASLLDRMEASGWVVREKDARDRRARRLRVLPAGVEKFEAARSQAGDLQSQVIAALPPADQASFLDQLTRIAEACRDASLSPIAPSNHHQATL